MRFLPFLKTTLLVVLATLSLTSSAQEVIVKPTILYTGAARKYTIGGINLSGVENLEPSVVIGLSGLSIGDVISVPGEEVTTAIKRYWKHGLFEDVSITADSIKGNYIYLGIALRQRPRVSQLNINGIKKSEREELEPKLGIHPGGHITPDIISRAEKVIKNYYDDKGYKNAEVKFVQRPDVTEDNRMIVDVEISKNEKIKINRIYIEGTSALSDKKVRYAMKKTREKTRFDNILYTLFRPKKFTKENYDEDKEKIISYYNEHGYRDARIVKDSVVAPILLFNEADAIFGKRIKEESSTDKMNNAIQNLILQEMEDLEGILIATTNMTKSFDAAFERRFLYKVRFEKPSLETKSKIWSSMMPELTESQAQELAREYDFSGGQIENISRKKKIQSIIECCDPDFATLKQYCGEEQLNSDQKRRRIGF